MVLLGEFDILDSLRVTDSNPDFSVNDVVGFHAEFNKEVDWTLVIEGQTTGSRKVITGFRVASTPMRCVDWGTSQVPFFTTEDCTVELTVFDEPDTMRTELTVAGRGSSMAFQSPISRRAFPRRPSSSTSSRRT